MGSQKTRRLSSLLRDDAGLSQTVCWPIIPILNGRILGLEYVEFGACHIMVALMG